MSEATRSSHDELSGNDWSALVPEENRLWTPTELVSICIPTRDPGMGLVNTLHALAAQTYPHHLLEVVVADDGSAAPPTVPSGLPFPVRIVRLEQTLAFGAGRARNAAAQASRGSILFFLDADVVPERQVVHVYARWFETRRDVLVMGLCRFVDMDDLPRGELVTAIDSDTMSVRFAGRDVDQQDWREKTFARTDDLKHEAIDAFRVTIGATLAVSREQFEEIGGFAELGVRGVEDTEFGYRSHANGAVLILDREARHWHQGRRNLSSTRRAEIDRVRAPFVQALMPIRGFRLRTAPPADAPVAVVPIARVHVQAGDDPVSTEHTRLSVLESERAGSGNASLGDGAPASNFDPAFVQVLLPAGVTWTESAAASMQDLFAGRAVGVIKAVDESGRHIVIARTRALRRARREAPDGDPFADAARLFGEWWVTAAAVGLESSATGPGSGQPAEETARVVRAGFVSRLAHWGAKDRREARALTGRPRALDGRPQALRVMVATVAHRGDDARILHRQIGALVDAGAEIEYIAPEPAGRHAGVRRVIVRRAIGRRRLRSWWLAFRAIRSGRDRVDVVLVHDLELVIPARLAAPRALVVWDVHENLPASVSDRGWIPASLRPVARLAVISVERIAAWRMPLILAEHSYRARLGDWPVVPNSTVVPPTCAPYDSSSPARVVYVGRLSVPRGLETMIELGRRASGRFVVELVGAVDANSSTMLQQAVDDGVVRWFGYRSNDEALAGIEGALAGLCLLQPLPNYVGSMPTKIYEYFARGVPVISTPLPLAVDAVDAAGAGFTVGHESVGEVLAAVDQLLSDPDLRVRQGVRGHHWVSSNHDWNRDGPAFVTTLADWVRARPTGGSRRHAPDG